LFLAEVFIKSRKVTVKGPRGTLTKTFKGSNLDIYMTGSKVHRKIFADSWLGTHKERACVQTILSIIRNMITGVTKGFEYKMRFVFAHFPINSTIADENKTLVINNFLGEKRARRIPMLGECTVKKSENTKDEIVITGNSLESVGQSAATVHQSCAVKNKDIRKFLDGCYVSERNVIGE
jgi:large subunit ribosomal protein L9e